MTNEKCNGWSNYETWNFNLWYGDDLQAQAQDLADEGQVVNHSTAHTLVEGYLDMLIEGEDLPTNGFFSDVINQAISAVDVHEIAESLVEGVEYQVAGIWQYGMEVYECLGVSYGVEDELIVRDRQANNEIEIAEIRYEMEDEEGNELEDPKPYVELSCGTILYLDDCVRVGTV